MIQEQEDLLHKARASYEAAQLLAEKGFYGFAVSRAYYAMFYVAEVLLLEKGLAFSKHSAVISAFGREFVKTECVPREFHKYLQDAEDDRLLGDYHSRTDLSKEEADIHLDHAQKFLDLAQRLLGHLSANPEK